MLLFIFPVIAFAQSSASFEAYADAKDVSLNSTFEVTFMLKNANGNDFIPPDFKNFIVIGGPFTSTSIQNVNGRVRSEMGFAYTLQPRREGKFVINSASIKVNGKKLSTDPLNITVVKAKPGSNDIILDKELYVRLEPSKTEAFLGEQILLDFKLYTTVSLEGYDIIEEPAYKGFFAQELKRFSSRTQREMINGKQVTTKILRRLALFPQQTGALVISPAVVQLAVIEENDRSGFFFSRNIRPVIFTTDSIFIDIQALPGNEPSTFTGAVGQFDFQATVNRNQATTDDAVSVIFAIRGNGDLKRVQAPPLILSDSFEIYPPKIINEESSEAGGELLGKKAFEYLVLPKHPGAYSIEPSFTYFNTETGTFNELTAGPFYLNVKKGSEAYVSKKTTKIDEKRLDDVHYIKLNQPLQKKGKAFVGSSIFWTLTLLPPLIFFSAFFINRIKNKKVLDDSSVLKSRNANRLAQKRLSLAYQFLQDSNNRAFYDEISKASLGYICDKLNIPISELSKENIKLKMKSLNVSNELIEDFVGIQKICEMALFAGAEKSEDMNSTYQKAKLVISKIEEGLT